MTMPQAKRGDTVQVHYTGTLRDGSVFDSSQGRGPLEFTIGQSHVIPGFEHAVLGMKVGDTRTVEIPPDQAYGAHDETLVIQIDPSRVPPDADLKVDDRMRVRRKDGSMLNVTVTAVSEAGVTLDGNHPLAGENLTFQIELVGIA
jgi:peptidylprolyl isomerase